MSFVRMREYNRSTGCLMRTHGSPSGRLYIAGEVGVKPSPVYEVGREELLYLIDVVQPKRRDVKVFEVLPADTREQLEALLSHEATERGRRGMPVYTAPVEAPSVAKPPRPQPAPQPVHTPNPPVATGLMYDGTNEDEVVSALAASTPQDPPPPTEPTRPAGMKRKTAADLLGDQTPDDTKPEGPPAASPKAKKAPAKKRAASKKKASKKAAAKKAAAKKPPADDTTVAAAAQTEDASPSSE